MASYGGFLKKGLDLGSRSAKHNLPHGASIKPKKKRRRVTKTGCKSVGANNRILVEEIDMDSERINSKLDLVALLYARSIIKLKNLC